LPHPQKKVLLEAMKNITLFFAIALFSLSSQNLSAQRFEGGIQGGFNFCQVDGDNNGGYNKLGLNGGLFVHYVLQDEKHNIGFDLMYMKKGSRNRRDPQSNSPDLIYHYHYIEIPVYYRYNQEKYALRAGLNWAYVFSSKYDDGGSAKEIRGLKNTDILWHFGGEYKFNDKLSLLAMYQYSLTTIIDIDRTQINVPFAQFRRNGVYHNLIQVSLKYYLSK